MFYTNINSYIKQHDTVENTPDIHGFVIMGKSNLFLEHISMFNMENHEYQCILRATIPEEDMKIINERRQKEPRVPLILANLSTDKYILPEIASGYRTSFIGEILIWETDDPQRNPRLISRVYVTIEQVIHYRHFTFQMGKISSLSYLLFGKDNEVFISHYVNESPNFMHILRLSEKPDWLLPVQVEACVLINFPDLPDDVLLSEDSLTERSYEVQYEGKKLYIKLCLKKKYGGLEWNSKSIINCIGGYINYVH
ncbi:hypothetical protein H0177_02645 [Bacillus cereus]|uniref:hypothetical protein n=1 Tax=Bacillus cereus TaxID=1396 RepID=UPI001C8DCA3E|nr:hypothetical protein [Bacillus cereus]MBY0129163.1 hypothetical protein [Bacillus cereus]